MTIQRLSILGVGLLGGSIGLKVKSILKGCKITGYGHRVESLKLATQAGAIDEYTTDPADAVKEADFVVLCTPVGTFEKLLSQIAHSFQPGAFVTDVGSTKRTICQVAEKTFPDGVHFVGSHPMAGSEQRGVNAARIDLYQNALCILTPTPKSDPSAVRRVDEFWKLLGMRTTRLSPEDHDLLLAMVSHLPHALAAALVGVQTADSVRLAGRGYADTTRIAAGDGALWRDIFLDNSDNVRQALRQLRMQLDRFESLLNPEKSDELRAWLDNAGQLRRRSDSEPV